ncbi:glutamyl-tRNA synthetase, partial [Pavlovales sp. CCMP2436]
AVVESLTHDGAGVVTSGRARLNLAGDVKSTKKKLTWLAADADNVPVLLVDLDHLISKDSLDEEEMLDTLDAPFITACTKEEHPALGEPALRALQKGQTIQRRGFYIVDVPYTRPGEPIKLFFVPDGKNMQGFRKPQPRAD